MPRRLPLLIILVSLLTLLTLPASAASDFQIQTLTLNVAGLKRKVLVWAPAQLAAKQQYAVIFAWHGAGSNPEQFRKYAGLEAQTGTNALIVYPQGLPTKEPETTSGWELDHDSRDVKLYDALLANLKQTYAIDEKRVFSYGYSFGAYFTHSLACQRGKQLRAVAVHAGGGPYFKPCQGPVAALLSHSSDDRVVLFEHGQESLNYYLSLNGCRSQSTPWQAGSVSYSGCQRPLHWLGLKQGGHDIPAEFPALAWRFFNSL